MTTVVLLSGGLDSAVLAAHEAQSARVLPVYVSVGLAWEDAEIAIVERLLAAAAFTDKVDPLARLSFTMRDVYSPAHWAIRGVPPAYDTPDQDVYLAGRNLVLLTKAGVVAAKAHAHRIALGPLAGNPFPDARPAFFTAMAEAMSLGLDHRIEIAAPFLDGLVYGVNSRDLLSIAGALVLAAAAAALGTYFPARRAARANILGTLRES